MVKINGNDEGGYECLWWVEYGGVHFPEATLPGMFSARGAGGHYVLVVPSLDLIIVHRTDNEPPISRNKVASDASRFFFVANFFVIEFFVVAKVFFVTGTIVPIPIPFVPGFLGKPA
jgi:hypothetical protein